MQRLSSCFARWTTLVQRFEQLSRLAHRAHDRRMLASSLESWTARAHTTRDQQDAAIAYHRMAVMRRAWGAWKAAQQSAAADRLIVDGDQRLLRGVWSAWRLHFMKRYQWRTSVALIGAQITLRLERDALRLWLDRVIDRRDAEWRAERCHSALLLRRSMSLWREALVQAQERTTSCASLVAQRERGKPISWRPLTRRRSSACAASVARYGTTQARAGSCAAAARCAGASRAARSIVGPVV